MKPVVGVTPLFDEKRSSVWMLPGYLELLQACGAYPIVLPLTWEEEDLSALLSLCDGFLFTGGHDIAPSLYGETPIPACGRIEPRRDSLEQALFRKAYDADRPIFGICRGLQIINVLMGGTLYQDLPTQRICDTVHTMDAPYDRVQHSVRILSDTPLHQLLGVDTLGVNSLHHQAIKQLAPNLIAMAQTSDGLVEAAFCPERTFLQGVQWHPEYVWNIEPAQCKLLKPFVDACRNVCR